MLFRSPVVRFFSRILNRVTITVVLVALQLLWLWWVGFSISPENFFQKISKKSERNLRFMYYRE